MDELYVMARRVLLNALEALGTHRDAAVLVGAQAVYLHAGDAEVAVAPFTTDADIVLDPALLAEIPPLEQALTAAGFQPMGGGGVGIWQTRQETESRGGVEVQVDLLVPSTVSPGRGKRAAGLAGHDSRAARKVEGLEGALVDRLEMEITSLEFAVDPRRITAKVAGPGALVVAKLYKISERRGTARSNDKDALDVLRLLQAVPTDELARRFETICAHERSAVVGKRALDLMRELFGDRGADGVLMAARATQPLMDETQVRGMCEALARDLLRALDAG